MTPFNKFHYFSISEIFAQNNKTEILDIISNDNICDNMLRLLEILEGVRTLYFGEPIYITSFYRNPEHNKNVGGVAKSFHLLGAAVDITCLNNTALLAELSDLNAIIKVIHYPKKNYIHIQLKKPKK